MMTIVVLLILAGVSINAVFSDEGIIKQAQKTEENNKILVAKEKIENELLNAKIKKETDGKYNKNDYLNQLILENVKNSKILGDIVIVDGFAFELERNTPKIEDYIGKETELIFPDLDTNIEVTENFKSATITITTEEKENGINKIEILQDDYVIKEYTYDNTKEKIIEHFTTKQNGKYIIKVHSKLSITKLEIISNLIVAIEYMPNGNQEYKKQHSVKITTNESIGKIRDIKYQWLQTTAEPNEDTFSEIIGNKETIIKSDITGTWYLWTLITTENGITSVDRSEAFYFDNEGPKITEFTATKYSETEITLSVTAQDIQSGISKIEFYVDDELKATEICDDTISSINKSKLISELNIGSHTCKVIIYDELENFSSETTLGTTKLYTWQKYSVNSTTTYQKTESKTGSYYRSYTLGLCRYTCYRFNTTTGEYNLGGSAYVNVDRVYNGYITCKDVSRANKIYYLNNRRNTYDIMFCMLNGYVWDQWTLSSTAKTTYSRGATDYGMVTSASSSTYPSNGKSGDYWFVYNGIM